MSPHFLFPFKAKTSCLPPSMSGSPYIFSQTHTSLAAPSSWVGTRRPSLSSWHTSNPGPSSSLTSAWNLLPCLSSFCPSGLLAAQVTLLVLVCAPQGPALLSRQLGYHFISHHQTLLLSLLLHSETSPLLNDTTWKPNTLVSNPSTLCPHGSDNSHLHPSENSHTKAAQAQVLTQSLAPLFFTTTSRKPGNPPSKHTQNTPPLTALQPPSSNVITMPSLPTFIAPHNDLLSSQQLAWIPRT